MLPDCSFTGFGYQNSAFSYIVLCPTYIRGFIFLYGQGVPNTFFHKAVKWVMTLLRIRHVKNMIRSQFLLDWKPSNSISANSVDPDEMQHNAASHQGLHCLSRYQNLQGQKYDTI